VYTAEYWAQLAIYPEGFIPDDCALLPNPPGEICDDRGTSTRPVSSSWYTTTNCNEGEGF